MSETPNFAPAAQASARLSRARRSSTAALIVSAVGFLVAVVGAVFAAGEAFGDVVSRSLNAYSKVLTFDFSGYAGETISVANSWAVWPLVVGFVVFIVAAAVAAWKLVDATKLERRAANAG